MVTIDEFDPSMTEIFDSDRKLSSDSNSTSISVNPLLHVSCLLLAHIGKKFLSEQRHRKLSFAEMQNYLVDFGLFLCEQGHPSFKLGLSFTFSQMLNVKKEELVTYFQSQMTSAFKGNNQNVISTMNTSRINTGLMNMLNAYKFYKPEVGKKLYINKLRIVGIGDSVTAGMGVQAAARSKRCFNQFIELMSESPCEIINCSIPGLETEDLLRNTSNGQSFIELLLSNYVPDLVICDVFGNNIRGKSIVFNSTLNECLIGLDTILSSLNTFKTDLFISYIDHQFKCEIFYEELFIKQFKDIMDEAKDRVEFLIDSIQDSSDDIDKKQVSEHLQSMKKLFESKPEFTFFYGIRNWVKDIVFNYSMLRMKFLEYCCLNSSRVKAILDCVIKDMCEVINRCRKSNIQIIWVLGVPETFKSNELWQMLLPIIKDAVTKNILSASDKSARDKKVDLELDKHGVMILTLNANVLSEECMSPDALHPNEEGHSRLALAMYKELNNHVLLRLMDINYGNSLVDIKDIKDNEENNSYVSSARIHYNNIKRNFSLICEKFKLVKRHFNKIRDFLSNHKLDAMQNNVLRFKDKFIRELEAIESDL